MARLRTQRADDVALLVDLATRSWQDVEAAIDAALGSPLDRLATPSWRAHHEAVVRAACDSDATAVVVAVDDDTPVGFVGYRVHPASPGMSAYGEVEVIAVDPAARGRGIGRALLDRAVADLRAAEVPVIMLQTADDDGHAPARALYESAGFRRLSTAQYWLEGRRAGERGTR